MPIPAQTGARVKVASTPTTIKAAPMTKVTNSQPAKVGIPTLTGGAAGHAGVGTATAKLDYSATNSLTTLQTAKQPKTVTTAPTVKKTTDRDKSYL